MSKTKSWQVKIDERLYKIEYKKGIYVNGQEIINKKVKSELNGITDYEFSVGMKTAHIYKKSLLGPQLVIGGKDCETGEDYIPMELPKWAYLFLVLHFLNFRNGIFGWIAAPIGLAATAAVSSNRKINIAIRVLLEIGILLGIYIIVISLAEGALGILQMFGMEGRY